MDLIFTACLLVLSTAVVVIGVLLVGIASDIRRARRALERLETPGDAGRGAGRRAMQPPQRNFAAPELREPSARPASLGSAL